MTKSYTVAVSDPTPAKGGKPASSGIYRNFNIAAGGECAPAAGIQTLWDSFSASCEKFPERNLFGTRGTQEDGKPGPFEWISYKDAYAQVKALSVTMAELGCKAEDRCGIFGTNAPEWHMAMQACNSRAMACVPLYDTLGDDSIEYIINHAECTIVFANVKKLDILGKALAKCPKVKTVITWGGEATTQLSVNTVSFEDAVKQGSGKPFTPLVPKSSDTCTIMYTSGTTGVPKGVVLTHEAVLAAAVGARMFGDEIDVGFSERDVLISYLPLAHIFERVLEEMFVMVGASIGYFRGDVTGLMDDVGALKPTLFPGVPRVFDRVYNGLMAKIEKAGGIKKFLFNWMYSRKAYFIENGADNLAASPLADKLVFSKVKGALGGNVRLILSGGAPLAKHVEEFLKVAFCARVCQGYGLTETCAASFVGNPNDLASTGTVGICMPSIEMKFESVPEMNYDATADPPAGEVCLRGKALFSEYYKMKDKTDEAVDDEGWFHTGDIGTLVTPQGYLKIVDRKKNIFKLAQGEYIAAEKVEEQYKKDSVVEQVWVYGNSFESFLVGVVVPTEAEIMAWAKKNGVAGDYAAVCQSEEAKKHVLAKITATAKANGLKSFEQMKNIKLESTMFSVDNDLLTPTFKLKRPQLQKHYQADLDAMYKAGLPKK
ncbi:unnamed protein product [Pedinophyceae sp. YPF-701]|nr:unnamed protein product [Pedinophyceae sp. YPF-701]